MSAPVLSTSYNPDDEKSRANAAHNRAPRDDLWTKVGKAALGGAGYTKDWPVERYYRDAKLLDIGAGTNEIRRMLIGRELIGAGM